jgi:hypothetical protein
LADDGSWEKEPISKRADTAAQLESMMDEQCYIRLCGPERVEAFRKIKVVREAHAAKFRQLKEGYLNVCRDKEAKRTAFGKVRRIIQKRIERYERGTAYPMSVRRALILLNPMSYGLFFDLVDPRTVKGAPEPVPEAPKEEPKPKPKRKRGPRAV